MHVFQAEMAGPGTTWADLVRTFHQGSEAETETLVAQMELHECAFQCLCTTAGYENRLARTREWQYEDVQLSMNSEALAHACVKTSVHLKTMSVASVIVHAVHEKTLDHVMTSKRQENMDTACQDEMLHMHLAAEHWEE